MKNHIAALVTFAVLIPFLFNPSSAYADVAPPPIPLVGGIGTLNYQATNVQMVAERVEMELINYEWIETGNPEYPEIRQGVTVNAWFTMHNNSSQAETMQVVFPLRDLNECPVEESMGGFLSYSYTSFDPATFQARVDGKIVETTVISTPHPWIESCLYHSDDQQMDWAAFDVTFPANEDTLIRVSYLIDCGSGVDSVFNVGYVLETGAGWKGPINEAIIVFRFPYTVDNFIMPGTTPGYQTMQNEIYWRYENFEPTQKDNIKVAFISPLVWDEIRESRQRIKANPQDDAAWDQLARSFSDIAHWHGPNIRSKDYDQRAYTVYRDGLVENPTSFLLNAGYVDLYTLDCCYYDIDTITETDVNNLLPHLEIVLQYDPYHETASWILKRIQEQSPESQITRGPAVTFTATAGPSPTPTKIGTPKPTATRIVPEGKSDQDWMRDPTVTSPVVSHTNTPGKTATHTPTHLPVKETILPDDHDIQTADRPENTSRGNRWIIYAVIGAGLVAAVFIFVRKVSWKR